MKNAIVRSLLLAGLSLVALTGCGQNQGLRVGVLNTARILEEMPAYRDLRMDLLKEKSSLAAELPDNPGDIDKARWDKFREESQKRQAAWQKKVMAFLDDSVKQIKTVTEEVAKQRDLDMVVINTPFSNAVHYTSGQDITIDVLLKLNK